MPRTRLQRGVLYIGKVFEAPTLRGKSEVYIESTAPCYQSFTTHTSCQPCVMNVTFSFVASDTASRACQKGMVSMNSICSVSVIVQCGCVVLQCEGDDMDVCTADDNARLNAISNPEPLLPL